MTVGAATSTECPLRNSGASTINKPPARETVCHTDMGGMEVDIEPLELKARSHHRRTSNAQRASVDHLALAIYLPSIEVVVDDYTFGENTTVVPQSFNDEDRIALCLDECRMSVAMHSFGPRKCTDRNRVVSDDLQQATFAKRRTLPEYALFHGRVRLTQYLARRFCW